MKVTKLSKFATAHRLRDYNGKCQNIHGHNYVVEITIEGTPVRTNSILVDFGELKSVFDGWLQENWDHAIIIRQDDHSLIEFCKAENMRHYIMPENSTAEYMASYLLKKFSEMLPKHFTDPCWMHSIKVWETDTSFAVMGEQ